MKKILMMAAALVLVGCGEKKAEAPAADTAAMAPVSADTGMAGASHGEMSDSTMARDTTSK